MINEQLGVPGSAGVSVPEEPKGGDGKKLIISVIIVVAMLASGAYAYVKFLKALPPEEVLSRSTQKSLEVKTASFSGMMNMHASAKDIGQASQDRVAEVDFDISFNGAADLEDKENPAASFNVDADIEVQDQAFTFGLETRMIQKKIYLMLTKAPAVPFFNLSSAVDKWVMIDPEEDAKNLGIEEDAAALSLTEGFSPEKIKEMQLALTSADILEITEELPFDTLRGVKTYHYKYNIKKEGLEEYLAKVAEVSTGQPMTAEEKAEFSKELAKIGPISGEVWIGKRDFMTYKITVNFTIAENKDGIDSNGEMAISIEMFDHNKPVEIAVPDDAQPAQEFIQSLFMGMQP